MGSPRGCLVLFLTSVCAVGKPELRTEVDIIVADVGEPDSLAAMCKQGVIVLNCVGPVSIPLSVRYIHNLSHTQTHTHTDRARSVEVQ